MLAQAFKSATELDITEPQKEALMKTLVLLETGKLVHVPDIGVGGSDDPKFTGHFNMCNYYADAKCGTICCIASTAELVGNIEFIHVHVPPALDDLFLPPMDLIWGDITPAQAATALRSYLTTGDAKWHEAIA